MRGILTGFVICCALALASPVAAEAQGEGKEKAAEQAQEAVNKETPAAHDRQPDQTVTAKATLAVPQPNHR